MRLKEMYQMITLGGDAELELVDSLDPFSEGIVFSVLLGRNVERFRGGLVFKAHRLLYHSTLGSKVRKKREGLPRLVSRGEL